MLGLGVILVTAITLLPMAAHAQGGTPLWTNRFDGDAKALAVDASGNAFVTGHYDDGVHVDYATFACSGAGEPLWTNYYDGLLGGQNYAKAVAVGTNGSVYVTD